MSLSFTKPLNRKGFTLTEILVVLTLLVILSGLGLAISLDSYRSHDFYSEESLLVGLLQKARSQAMDNLNQQPHGVYFNQADSSCTLFEGTDYAHRDALLDLNFPGNSNYRLEGLAEVIFNQLTGDSDTAGNIILKDKSQKSVTIGLNSEGQIDVQ